MAETIWLLKRSKNGAVESHINGVQAMLLNADNAQTLAQNNVTAQGIMNTKFGGTPFGSAYFTSQHDIGDLSTGYMKDAGDAVIVTDYEVSEVATGA